MLRREGEGLPDQRQAAQQAERQARQRRRVDLPAIGEASRRSPPRPARSWRRTWRWRRSCAGSRGARRTGRRRRTGGRDHGRGESRAGIRGPAGMGVLDAHPGIEHRQGEEDAEEGAGEGADIGEAHEPSARRPWRGRRRSAPRRRPGRRAPARRHRAPWPYLSRSARIMSERSPVEIRGWLYGTARPASLCAASWRHSVPVHPRDVQLRACRNHRGRCRIRPSPPLRPRLQCPAGRVWLARPAAGRARAPYRL